LALNEFRSTLAAICRKTAESFDTEIPKLFRRKVLPYTDKYDYLLPQKLLEKQYTANMLEKIALEKLADELAV
jgi:hypothetical protein